MSLLRNASGLIIPSSTAGRSGRADDPEFHISRLEHFGQGMGVDLASTHSLFSGKNMASFEDHDDEELDFNSHDEGLMLSRGHIDAARSAVFDNTSGGMQELRNGALQELEHRRPYTHRARSSGTGDLTGISGMVYKDTSEPIPSGDPSVKPTKWISSMWGQDTGILTPSTHTDAIKDVRSRFEQFNMNRKGPSADVNSLVSKSINNPNELHMDHHRRVIPSLLSAQFLGIGHFPQDESKEFHDHIDLKTGNWAKIDPEGYFSD
jgi:hypothetical protein